MTIKKKLFFLVFGELLMFIAVVAVALFSLLPILTINKEFSELSALAQQVVLMEVKVIGLITEPLGLQYEAAIEVKEELDTHFDAISKHKRLNRINTKVEKSMISILSLEKIFDSRWTEVLDATPTIIEYAQEYMYTTTSPLTSFYKSDWLDRYGDADEILEAVSDYEGLVKIAEGALSSAYYVISTQYEIINSEISKQIRSLFMRTFFIFIVMLIITIFFAVRITIGMAGSIFALEKGVSLLREGRLHADFKTSSKDEIALLGENLNNFTSELSQSIIGIMDSSGRILDMKKQLAGAADGSNTARDGITDAVTSIKEGMVDLDSKVAESGDAVNTVRTRTDELKSMLEEQTAMIEESTSSVTEMMASINNVSDITGKKKAATDELVRTAGAGGEKLDETIRVIQNITGNVDEIRGTASIIQSVAAQTSLLAMNAAIEAAHAGDAGAGFSVVAEEIRKLADASGKSSKQISGVLKDVVGSIEQAASSGDDTKRAFADINREITDVAGALDEISSSMHELAAGGHQILEAMTSLQGFASGVKDSGAAMTDASSSLEEAFRIVERVASGVLMQVGGIGSRVDEISSAVGVVSDISGKLSHESGILENEVSRFKT